MKQKLEEKIKIPQGITCVYENETLKCSSSSGSVERKLSTPDVEFKINDGEIVISCRKGNKNHYKKIKTFIAHIKNMFNGLNENFNYTLEICHVHFPMTVKVEGNRLSISNFFGEKKPRGAEIMPNVKVDIKGSKITVSSADKEAAGKTAANFERATKLKGRDRRIFQDGIYITSKPGDEND